MMTIEQRSYAITVDYNRSFEEMIADGKYDYVSPNITCQNFPITGTGVVEEEIILVHFDRYIKSDDAVRELNEMGLKPAKLEHACALGAKHPDLQREYAIVFLGSVWTHHVSSRHVPCLGRWRAGRELRFDRWPEVWACGYRFAALSTPPVA